MIQTDHRPRRRRQLAARRRCYCIKVLGGSQAPLRRRSATSSSSRSARRSPNAKVKKGEVAKAVIVRTAQGDRPARRQLHPVRRQLARCSINKENEPIGTRIFGPVARELRAKKFMKIISLAPEVL